MKYFFCSSCTDTCSNEPSCCRWRWHCHTCRSRFTAVNWNLNDFTCLQVSPDSVPDPMNSQSQDDHRGQRSDSCGLTEENKRYCFIQIHKHTWPQHARCHGDKAASRFWVQENLSGWGHKLLFCERWICWFFSWTILMFEGVSVDSKNTNR